MICLSLLVTLAPIVAVTSGGALEVRKTEQGQLEVHEAGQLVLRYNYATVPLSDAWRSASRDPQMAAAEKYAVPRSDYIHPLCGLNGVPLTIDWAHDHPHHRGIYWAWPEVAFQGQLGDLHALQNVWARPTGRVEWHIDESRAVITAENEWHWQDTQPIVRELVRLQVHPRGPHGRYVDLHLTFRALAEQVTLARRGTNAYGGLNVRLAPIRRMQLSHYADPETAAPRAAWQAASGVWAGSERSSWLVILESARNPDYPGDYVEFPDLPWFQPAFPSAGTRYPLDVGADLQLAYRIWLGEGDPPSADECRRQWQLFQSAPLPDGDLP